MRRLEDVHEPVHEPEHAHDNVNVKVNEHEKHGISCAFTYSYTGSGSIF